jgi:hypothetical protein
MAYPKYPTYKQMKHVLKRHGVQGLFEAGRAHEQERLRAAQDAELVQQRLDEAQHREKVRTAAAGVAEKFAGVNEKLKDL